MYVLFDFILFFIFFFYTRFTFFDAQLPYDSSSIMHYTSSAFSTNGQVGRGGEMRGGERRGG